MTSVALLSLSLIHSCLFEKMLPPAKKKLLCVRILCVGGSNIFARRVTVDEYEVPSKMSTNTSLVRTPSTDSHVEGVLRRHPCYFSNISAITCRLAADRARCPSEYACRGHVGDMSATCRAAMVKVVRTCERVVVL